MENRFITIGEIMMRLTPPNYDKIRVTQTYEASFGGAEANIALALANLGIDSTFFTVVPDNSLGKSAMYTVARLFYQLRRRHQLTDLVHIIWRRDLEFVLAR